MAAVQIASAHQFAALLSAPCRQVCVFAIAVIVRLCYNGRMDIVCQNHCVRGKVSVPGSKSHTIRALLLAALAQGTSHINNPLHSDDCLAAKRAIDLIGASSIEEDGQWVVTGAGHTAHLPYDVVNVGDSGSLLYFMSAVAATFDGWSIFTGDEAIRKRPVAHVADALRQLGCEAYTARPGVDAPPLLIKGPIMGHKVVTAGSVSSQYISGIMIAATRVFGGIEIELTNPKETPYLTMTKIWLESLGVRVDMSNDFHHIMVDSPLPLEGFDTVIPSDWEAVAFPLVAALMNCGEGGEYSNVIIQNVDGSASQGDDAIVPLLQSVGANIKWDRENETLIVQGGRLSSQGLSGEELHADLSSWPDGICALAAVACVIEGVTVIEDVAVCRKKECDRITVMRKALVLLGVEAEEGPDCLVIRGHSPVTSSGEKNPAFTLHGGTVETCGDHRVAMALACLGLAMPKGEKLIVKGAECCAVSFPNFLETMNGIGAGYSPLEEADVE